ncbi:ATP-binding protein [Chondromyces crocatus]|nr:ATP-binding protein [Chondromyces crocatus]
MLPSPLNCAFGWKVRREACVREAGSGGDGALVSSDGELLRQIAEMSPLLICYVDRDQRYRMVNRAYEGWFGVAPEELIGHHVRDVVGEQAYAPLKRPIEAALSGERITLETKLLYRKGGLRYVRVNYVPHRSDEGEILGYLALIEDLSERQRLEEIRRFLAEATAILASSLDYMDSWQRVARLATSTVADWCWIHDLAPDGTLRLVHVEHADTDMTDRARTQGDPHRARVTAPSPFHDILEGRSAGFVTQDLQSLAAGQATADAEHLAYLLSLKHRSTITVPIPGQGKIIGALTLASSEPGRFDGGDDRSITEELARRLGLAEQHARALQAEQEARLAAERATRRMSLLQHITAALANAITAEEVADVVLTHGLPAAGLRGGAVLLTAEGGAALEVLRSQGYPPGVLEAGQRVPIPVDEGGALAALAAAGSLLPLDVGARHHGYLAIGLDATRPLPAEDHQLHVAIATQCAQALERARLHQERAELHDHAQRIAAENAALYQEARESEERKDEFLAMLCHELRNPLTPMLMGLELLRRGLRNNDLDRNAAIIQRQAETIARLVEDLLDISRITRGKIELRRHPLDVASVMASAVETARPLVESRQHALTIEAPEGLQIEADWVRIEQVLTNLLNNAAKYTDPGGNIALSAARDGGNVVLSVRDTGLGIPADALPHIFEPFMQAERSLDHALGGLGIGLTLVKRLVELHGGHVEALSEGAGMGTEVRVRIPLTAAALPS